MNTSNLFEQAAGFALLAAFYPPAMLIAALYLASERPGRVMAFYVTGGIVMVTVVAVAALIAIRAGDLSHVGHHQTRYGLRLALGVLAIIAAVFLWRRQRKPADQAKPRKPGLVQRLSARPTPLTAFAAGAVMFGPSLTFVAAVQVVGTAKVGVGETVAAMAMIIVLTVAFAWLPLIAYAVAPQRTVRLLRHFESWLKLHGKTVLTGAVGLVGILLVIQGILGLT
ncbi:MAG TPA: GAP family protein [Streptosporangiaceae bacterium]|nr:GAP family protein [Streptosporangiaceae bacterium]